MPKADTEPTEPLVNETLDNSIIKEQAEEIGRLKAETMALSEEITQTKFIIQKKEKEINKLGMHIQKGGFTDESRKFRLLLSIMSGFVSRGLFDPEVLSKKPGTETPLCKHAAKLAEIANKAGRDCGY